MGRPRHLRALPLALAALLLAACGGHPDATPPRPSPTPSPTASTPTAPVMPALARQHTDAGAKAFVRYYIALVNRGAATGSVNDIARLSSRGCESCRTFVANVGKMYAAGGSMVGGSFRPERISIPTGGHAGSRTTVDVSVSYGAQTFRRTSRAKTIHFKPGNNLLTFILVSRNGWRVDEWTSAK